MERQSELETRLTSKLDAHAVQQGDLWQTFSEGLQMHANEMDAESRKLRLFTDSRFKLKSDQSDKSIMAVEEECKKKIALIVLEAEEAGNAVKYRLDDFRTQLDHKVSQD